MRKETAFFIYLLERYAEEKGKTADQVLKEWDSMELPILFTICTKYTMWSDYRMHLMISTN